MFPSASGATGSFKVSDQEKRAEMRTCRVMVAALAATALLVAGGAFAGKGDACRRNLATAEKSAVVTNGVKWIDGRYLPVEGRAFDDVEIWGWTSEMCNLL